METSCRPQALGGGRNDDHRGGSRRVCRHDSGGSNCSSRGPDDKQVAGTEAVAHGIEGGYSGDHGLATAAQLSRPSDVTVAPDGAVYIADSGNRVVRRIGRDGSIARWRAAVGPPCGRCFCHLSQAGRSNQPGRRFRWSLVCLHERKRGPPGVDGPVRLNHCPVLSGVSEARSDPEQASGWDQHVGGLAVGGDGTLYIADRAGSRIWKRSPHGAITALPVPARPATSAMEVLRAEHGWILLLDWHSICVGYEQCAVPAHGDPEGKAESRLDRLAAISIVSVVAAASGDCGDDATDVHFSNAVVAAVGYVEVSLAREQTAAESHSSWHHCRSGGDWARWIRW